MIIKELTIGLERTERHEKYFMSKPSVKLSATLEPGDELRSVFEEISNDVRTMADEMVQEEARLYEKKYRKD